LYSAVLADASFRWRLLRDDEFTTNIPENYQFCVGTDEHGKKIFNSALAKGLTPKQHCDQYSERFKNLFNQFGILSNKFIRTTSPIHIEAVSTFWVNLIFK
jgi:methionyl-tRNA synthetase